jgi:poly-gamma-glutamate synthesis protein (capsule biosynthesis protein)
MTVLVVLLFILPGQLLPGAPGQDREDGTFTLAGLGDYILGRKVSMLKEPGFLKWVELVRAADCAWLNCELPLVDTNSPGVYPQERDGLVLACKPWGADELKWLGIDAVGLANNHSMDFGYAGLFSTIKHLDRVGIGYAGAGKDLEYASGPGYIDTDKGRVAQLGCAYWFEPGNHASMPHPYMKGRPGINPLRNTEIITLGKEDFGHLRKIDDKINTYLQFPPAKEPQKKVYMDDIVLMEGKSFKYEDRLNKKDVERMKESVKMARRNARIVIVSIHQHMGFDLKPSESIEAFARQCIDAGADVVFGTGPAKLYGIEIYKNKPIFYSLGNLFFHSDAYAAVPAELLEMWGLPPHTRDVTVFIDKLSKRVEYFSKDFHFNGMLPIITFEKGNRVKRIDIYPLIDRKDRPVYFQGTPVLAEKKEARGIIKKIIDRSQRYRTKIVYRDGIGVIEF